MRLKGSLFSFCRRAYGTVGSVILLSISAVMFVDVIGRYFGAPIKGSFDIVEALMALIAFWFLPLLSLGNQHISVTIFKAKSGIVAKIQRVFIEAFCSAVALLMAWSLFSIGKEFDEIQEASLILGLPKFPFVYICASVVVIMACVHFVKFIRAVVSTEELS